MKQIGLGHLRWAFEKNDVDGPLLSALAHRHFGAVMLESMGFSISEQQVLVSGVTGRFANGRFANVSGQFANV